MAEYLAQRIIDGAVQYNVVIAKYPQYKERINTYLTNKDRVDLIPVEEPVIVE